MDESIQVGDDIGVQVVHHRAGEMRCRVLGAPHRVGRRVCADEEFALHAIVILSQLL